MMVMMMVTKLCWNHLTAGRQSSRPAVGFVDRAQDVQGVRKRLEKLLEGSRSQRLRHRRGRRRCLRRASQRQRRYSPSYQAKNHFIHLSPPDGERPIGRAHPFPFSSKHEACKNVPGSSIWDEWNVSSGVGRHWEYLTGLRPEVRGDDQRRAQAARLDQRLSLRGASRRKLIPAPLAANRSAMTNTARKP